MSRPGAAPQAGVRDELVDVGAAESGPAIRLYAAQLRRDRVDCDVVLLNRSEQLLVVAGGVAGAGFGRVAARGRLDQRFHRVLAMLRLLWDTVGSRPGAGVIAGPTSDHQRESDRRNEGGAASMR